MVKSIEMHQPVGALPSHWRSLMKLFQMLEGPNHWRC